MSKEKLMLIQKRYADRRGKNSKFQIREHVQSSQFKCKVIDPYQYNEQLELRHELVGDVDGMSVSNGSFLGRSARSKSRISRRSRYNSPRRSSRSGSRSVNREQREFHKSRNSMLHTSGRSHEGNEGAMVMKDGSIVSRRSLRDSRCRTANSPHGRNPSLASDRRSVEKVSSIGSEESPSPVKLCSAFKIDDQKLNRSSIRPISQSLD